MKDSLTTPLTLAIMVIGLAMMVGGPRAVRCLFAPFLIGLRCLAQRLFSALLVSIILAAALYSERHEPSQAEATEQHHHPEEQVEGAIPTHEEGLHQ